MKRVKQSRLRAGPDYNATVVNESGLNNIPYNWTPIPVGSLNSVSSLDQLSSQFASLEAPIPNRRELASRLPVDSQESYFSAIEVFTRNGVKELVDYMQLDVFQTNEVDLPEETYYEFPKHIIDDDVIENLRSTNTIRVATSDLLMYTQLVRDSGKFPATILDAVETMQNRIIKMERYYTSKQLKEEILDLFRFIKKYEDAIDQDDFLILSRQSWEELGALVDKRLKEWSFVFTEEELSEMRSTLTDDWQTLSSFNKWFQNITTKFSIQFINSIRSKNESIFEYITDERDLPDIQNLSKNNYFGKSWYAYRVEKTNQVASRLLSKADFPKPITSLSEVAPLQETIDKVRATFPNSTIRFAKDQNLSLKNYNSPQEFRVAVFTQNRVDLDKRYEPELANTQTEFDLHPEDVITVQNKPIFKNLHFDQSLLLFNDRTIQLTQERCDRLLYSSNPQSECIQHLQENYFLKDQLPLLPQESIFVEVNRRYYGRIESICYKVFQVNTKKSIIDMILKRIRVRLDDQQINDILSNTFLFANLRKDVTVYINEYINKMYFQGYEYQEAFQANIIAEMINNYGLFQEDPYPIYLSVLKQTNTYYNVGIQLRDMKDMPNYSDRMWMYGLKDNDVSLTKAWRQTLYETQEKILNSALATPWYYEQINSLGSSLSSIATSLVNPIGFWTKLTIITDTFNVVRHAVGLGGVLYDNYQLVEDVSFFEIKSLTYTEQFPFEIARRRGSDPEKAILKRFLLKYGEYLSYEGDDAKQIMPISTLYASLFKHTQDYFWLTGTTSEAVNKIAANITKTNKLYGGGELVGQFNDLIDILEHIEKSKKEYRVSYNRVKETIFSILTYESSLHRDNTSMINVVQLSRPVYKMNEILHMRLYELASLVYQMNENVPKSSDPKYRKGTYAQMKNEESLVIVHNLVTSFTLVNKSPSGFLSSWITINRMFDAAYQEFMYATDPKAKRQMQFSMVLAQHLTNELYREPTLNYIRIENSDTGDQYDTNLQGMFEYTQQNKQLSFDSSKYDCEDYYLKPTVSRDERDKILREWCLADKPLSVTPMKLQQLVNSFDIRAISTEILSILPKTAESFLDFNEDQSTFVYFQDTAALNFNELTNPGMYQNYRTTDFLNQLNSYSKMNIGEATKYADRVVEEPAGYIGGFVYGAVTEYFDEFFGVLQTIDKFIKGKPDGGLGISDAKELASLIYETNKKFSETTAYILILQYFGFWAGTLRWTMWAGSLTLHAIYFIIWYIGSKIKKTIVFVGDAVATEIKNTVVDTITKIQKIRQLAQSTKNQFRSTRLKFNASTNLPAHIFMFLSC